MVLENRMEAVIAGSSASQEHRKMSDTLQPFMDQVASANPAPGGGSVAATAGALGTSLGQMAIKITKDKKNYAQYADRYSQALEQLARHASTFLELVDADAEAYGHVMAAYKLPKDSKDRETAIQAGLLRATEAPSRIAQGAADVLTILEDLRPIIHVNVASDLLVGFDMLRSALQGAIANMRTNLKDVKDQDTHVRYETMIIGWEQILRRG
jgi:glutamate formiminotransferase/formiminotetrahydrofolate cyclodeaminase